MGVHLLTYDLKMLVQGVFSSIVVFVPLISSRFRLRYLDRATTDAELFDQPILPNALISPPCHGGELLTVGLATVNTT
jgi:hypothetical protein